MTDEVRKWEDKPYGPNDSKIFSVFERDLMDDLQAAKGFRQVLHHKFKKLRFIKEKNQLFLWLIRRFNIAVKCADLILSINVSI